MKHLLTPKTNLELLRVQQAAVWTRQELFVKGNLCHAAREGAVVVLAGKDHRFGVEGEELLRAEIAQVLFVAQVVFVELAGYVVYFFVVLQYVVEEALAGGPALLLLEDLT